jgi:hypothetical protein
MKVVWSTDLLAPGSEDRCQCHLEAAAILFSRFMSLPFPGVFCGKSTIPLGLGEANGF